MILSLLIISIIGLFLSLYAFYVERRAFKNQQYQSVCDLSEKASCSKAFTSPFGKIFGISNSVVGAVFYLLVIFLAFYNQALYIFYLSVPTILITSYLAYILYFRMKNLCIVCTCVYIINLLLLIFGYLEVF